MLAFVLEDDTLAPCLFIIALYYALREAIVNELDLGITVTTRTSKQNTTIAICGTDFAYDITEILNTIDQAQYLLNFFFLKPTL